MKYFVYIVLFAVLMTFSVFSEPEIKNNTSPVCDQNITILGRDRNKWIVRIVEKNNSVFLFDINTRKMSGFPVDEKNILSVQFISIPYIKESIIEVVATTNNGDGSLYLFNTNMRNILKTRYYDSYYENIGSDVFQKMEILKGKNISAQRISRIYRDKHLTVEYDDIKNKTVKVFGVCDYVTNENGVEEVIVSEPVEKYFQYIEKTKEYRLMNNISIVENSKWFSN